MGNTVDCCSGNVKVEQKPTIQEEDKRRKAQATIEEDDELPAEIGGKMSADDAFSNPFAAPRHRKQAHAGASSSSPSGRSRRPPDIDMSPPDHPKAARSPPSGGGDWTPNRFSVQQAKEAKLVSKNSAMWDSPASSTSSIAHC